MALHTCWKCGSGYDGVNCHVCAINKQAEQDALRASRDQEKATAAMEAAIAEQTAQLAEEMSRAREAAEAAAFETQMAIAEAAENQQRAMAKAAEEHRRTTANAWKLQAQAKSDQAYRLYQSGLLTEAFNLAIQAIREDPANIDGAFVAGACLEGQGKVEEAHAYLAKQVQMLSMPDYRMQLKIYSQVLHAIGSDPILIKVFCKILRDHLPLWPACEQIEIAERFIDALLAIEEYQLAVMTQKWVVQSKSLTLETLTSTRRLFNTIASSQSAIDASLSELQKIVQWIESASNSVSEYSLRSKTGRTALFAIVSSLELSSYLHLQSGLLGNYFKDLPFDKRTEFEAELSQLKQLVASGQVNQNAFSAILDAAKEKYASWKPHIEEQVRTTATAQLQNLPKHGSGCLLTFVWFVILLAIPQVGFYIVTRSIIQPGGPLYAVYDFGALLGGILLASLTVHVRRAFHKYRSAHQLMTSASNQQNATLGQLGLPQISVQEPTLRPPSIDLMICSAVAISFLIGWQILLLTASRSASTPSSRNVLYNGNGFEDEMKGKSSGHAVGIRWTNAIGNRGAVFSAANSSRIEYPGLIPAQGTLEFWIKVNDGYHYDNYRFMPNQSDAMIFSSDVQGGDVTWPGTTKIFVSRDGTLSIWLATVKGPNHIPATEARSTEFRFGEWHAIGVSYGSQGQAIMLDGKIVASAPSRTQTFGAAGTQQSPLDIPTIGETVSHFWQHHRYEGGFEGVLAGFRVSGKQADWTLAKGITENVSAVPQEATSGQQPQPSDNGQPNTGNPAANLVPGGADTSNTSEPHIESVSSVSPREVQTITISGSGFGAHEPYTGDSDYIKISDLTKQWNAGWTKDPGSDKVTLVVTSWTDTSIVISGFAGAYGTWGNYVNEGDAISFQLWNAQSALGPATYNLVASESVTTAGSSELAIAEMVSHWAAAHAANDSEGIASFYAALVDSYFDLHNVTPAFILQNRRDLLNNGVRLSQYQVVNVIVTMNSENDATVNFEKLWSTRPGGSMPNRTKSRLQVRKFNWQMAHNGRERSVVGSLCSRQSERFDPYCCTISYTLWNSRIGGIQPLIL